MFALGYKDKSITIVVASITGVPISKSSQIANLSTFDEESASRLVSIYAAAMKQLPASIPSVEAIIGRDKEIILQAVQTIEIRSVDSGIEQLPSSRVMPADSSELSDKQKEYFKALEKQFAIKPGTFESFLSQPKNLATIKTLPGLFKIVAKSNPKASFKYHSTLFGDAESSMTDAQFLTTIRNAIAEPNKGAWLPLRLVRRWLRSRRERKHKPSFDDQLDNLAAYFMNEAKQKEYRSLITGASTTSAASEDSSTSRILQTVPAEPAATASATSAAAPVAASTSSTGPASSGHGLFAESEPVEDKRTPDEKEKVDNRPKHEK